MIKESMMNPGAASGVEVKNNQAENPETLVELQNVVSDIKENFGNKTEIVEGIEKASSTTENIVKKLDAMPEGPAKEEAILNVKNIIGLLAGLTVAGYAGYQIAKGEHSAFDQENLGNVSAMFIGTVGASFGLIRSWLKKEVEKENNTRLGLSS